MIEVADEKAPAFLSEAEVRAVKERESEYILAHDLASSAHAAGAGGADICSLIFCRGTRVICPSR